MAQPFIVDFPVNDLLLPYKEQLIEEFYEQIKTKTDPGYSRKVHIEPVLNIIKPLWVEKIKYHFDPLPLSQPEFKVWLYVQNNTNNRCVWHNHPEAELNTVFYLDVPEEGGELEILNVKPSQNKLNADKLKVENNKLYIMPFWTYHRPLPQKDTKERLCFNIQFQSRDRIRLKQRNGINW